MDYEYGNVNNQITNNGIGKSPDEKMANILCGISLACVVIAIVSFFVFARIQPGLQDAGIEVPDIIFNVLETVEGLLVLAGVVIMIYVRVRYPKNVFAKVLMWTYIVLAIVAIVLFIAFMIFLYMMCGALAEGCQGCQRLS